MSDRYLPMQSLTQLRSLVESNFDEAVRGLFCQIIAHQSIPAGTRRNTLEKLLSILPTLVTERLSELDSDIRRPESSLGKIVAAPRTVFRGLSRSWQQSQYTRLIGRVSEMINEEIAEKNTQTKVDPVNELFRNQPSLKNRNHNIRLSDFIYGILTYPQRFLDMSLTSHHFSNPEKDLNGIGLVDGAYACWSDLFEEYDIHGLLVALCESTVRDESKSGTKRVCFDDAWEIRQKSRAQAWQHEINVSGLCLRYRRCFGSQSHKVGGAVSEGLFAESRLNLLLKRLGKCRVSSDSFHAPQLPVLIGELEQGIPGFNGFSVYEMNDWATSGSKTELSVEEKFLYLSKYLAQEGMIAVLSEELQGKLLSWIEGNFDGENLLASPSEEVFRKLGRKCRATLLRRFELVQSGAVRELQRCCSVQPLGTRFTLNVLLVGPTENGSSSPVSVDIFNGTVIGVVNADLVHVDGNRMQFLVSDRFDSSDVVGNCTLVKLGNFFPRHPGKGGGQVVLTRVDYCEQTGECVEAESMSIYGVLINGVIGTVSNAKLCSEDTRVVGESQQPIWDWPMIDFLSPF